MFLRDYKIIISADNSDNTYWQLIRKGTPKIAEREELIMVSNVFGKLKERIDDSLL